MISRARRGGDLDPTPCCSPTRLGSMIPRAPVPVAPTGMGGGGLAAAARWWLVVASVSIAAVGAGCGSDQPALTLVFEQVPDGTTRFEVTLHAMGATFMGPDAGNEDVGVRYDSGNVVIRIDRP